MNDPADRTISNTYDLAGRRTRMVDPDAGTWDYGYDAVGNPTMVKDSRPSGNVTYTNFDALNRPTERREANPTTGRLLANWAYDADGQKGLLDSSTSWHRRPDGQGDEAFINDIGAYDDRSRPASRTYTVFADRGGLFGSYPITYVYDRADHVTSTIYPQINDANGQEVLPLEWLVTEYTSLGLPARMDSNLLAAADDAYLNAAGYDDRARPVWFGYGQQAGGLWKFWSYDAAQRLTGTAAWAKVNTAAQTVLQNRSVAYDQTQNVTRRTTTVGDKEWVDCYGYDDRNRLTRAFTTGQTDACADSGAGTGDAPYDQSFAYTIDGNITGRVDNVTSSNPTTYDYGYSHPGNAAGKPAHGPASIDSSVSGEDVSYAWDQAGPLTERERSNGDYDTLAWTADRHLDRVQDPNGNTRDSFAYDVDGNRVLRENVDRTTIYIEGHEISANGGGGVTAVRSYTLDGQPLATRTRDTSTATAALEYLVTDNQGSVELSVKAGENTPSAQRGYQPYGTRSGSEFLTDRGWIGQVEDDRTGLNYLNARYYDPFLTRFISPDPLYDPGRPQTINPYQYGMNNPSTNPDPTGLIPDACLDAGSRCTNDGSGWNVGSRYTWNHNVRILNAAIENPGMSLERIKGMIGWLELLAGQSGSNARLSARQEIDARADSRVGTCGLGPVSSTIMTNPDGGCAGAEWTRQYADDVSTVTGAVGAGCATVAGFTLNPVAAGCSTVSTGVSVVASTAHSAATCVDWTGACRRSLAATGLNLATAGTGSAIYGSILRSSDEGWRHFMGPVLNHTAEWLGWLGGTGIDTSEPQG